MVKDSKSKDLRFKDLDPFKMKMRKVDWLSTFLLSILHCFGCNRMLN